MCFTSKVIVIGLDKILFRTQKTGYGDCLWPVDGICSLLLPQSLKSYIYMFLFPILFRTQVQVQIPDHLITFMS